MHLILCVQTKYSTTNQSSGSCQLFQYVPADIPKEEAWRPIKAKHHTHTHTHAHLLRHNSVTGRKESQTAASRFSLPSSIKTGPACSRCSCLPTDYSVSTMPCLWCWPVPAATQQRGLVRRSEQRCSERAKRGEASDVSKTKNKADKLDRLGEFLLLDQNAKNLVLVPYLKYFFYT